MVNALLHKIIADIENERIINNINCWKNKTPYFRYKKKLEETLKIIREYQGDHTINSNGKGLYRIILNTGDDEIDLAEMWTPEIDFIYSCESDSDNVENNEEEKNENSCNNYLDHFEDDIYDAIEKYIDSKYKIFITFYCEEFQATDIICQI